MSALKWWATNLGLELSPRSARLVLGALAAIFLGLGVAASGLAFFYPLEIETRESTVWLYVLALREGINIYDHGRVAFVNMNHGPFDPLFKFAVATLCPFLESWQVTRIAVFLLPYAFLLLTPRLIARSPSASRLQGLCLAGMGYLFLLLCAKDVILLGRSDATVALLFLPLVYLSISFSASTRSRAALHGLACGAIATAAMLTNWRAVPAVVAVLGIALWTYWKGGPVSRTLTAGYLTCYLGASLALCGVILHYFFHFDLGLYYKHFVGFYARGAGWVDSSAGGAIPFGDSYDRSKVSFLVSLFSPAADAATLKGGPLLPALAAWLLIPAKGWSLNRAWGVLSLWVLVFCAMAYYLQYYGGGPYYFVPFFILLWFWVCKNSAAMGATRTAVLGVVLLALVGVNYRTVVGPTLRRALGIERAYRFMGTVRSLEETSTVLSEDTFLFRRALRGELIDMGDTVAAFRRTGYFGEAFNRTVDRHFDRVRRDPPDYVVAGFTESPELRALIEKRYTLIAEGPRNLSANGGRTSKLFKRKDAAVD